MEKQEDTNTNKNVNVKRSIDDYVIPIEEAILNAIKPKINTILVYFMYITIESNKSKRRRSR